MLSARVSGFIDPLNCHEERSVRYANVVPPLYETLRLPRSYAVGFTLLDKLPERSHNLKLDDETKY
ncbi:MAG: hypothetical protein RMY34_34735 [Aulosira sp. DedQUE10]|nr:hypothetical protein [Aulosira sp. DedQUE10]